MGDQRESIDALRRELAALQRRDEALTADVLRLRHELSAASAMQRDLLQSPLPEVEGVEVQAFHRPAEEVSGDTHGVVRLDETRVAFFVADATGHGMSAAMLSEFVQRAVAAPRWMDGVDLRLSPGLLMTGLNDRIWNMHFRECQSVALLYAVYDERSRVVRWARGGAPYPVFLRAGRPPRRIISEGRLLGVTPDPRFETRELRPAEGDVILFHTDGLDALSASEALGSDEVGLNRWWRSLGDGSLRRGLDKLPEMLLEARQSGLALDDTTVLALHMTRRRAGIQSVSPHSMPAVPATL